MPNKPPEHAKITRCRGATCGADIFFVVSEKQGRPLPVNAIPERRYVLKWKPPGQDGLAEGHYRAALTEVFVPHHATCPDVGAFKPAAARIMDEKEK